MSCLFPKYWDTRLLCGKGALKLNVHYKKRMPQSAPCIPTPCAGHTASCCSPLLTCSFFLEEKPNEQGNRVLPCLLAWTTWARDIGDTPYPERPEKILKRQLAKLCSGLPESLFLQPVCPRPLHPAALLCCSCSEAFQSVSLTVCHHYQPELLLLALAFFLLDATPFHLCCFQKV